jgi:hypothetical protein
MLGGAAMGDASVEGERYEAPAVAARGASTIAAMADTSSHQLMVVDSERQRSVASIGREPIQALSVVAMGDSTLVFAVATPAARAMATSVFSATARRCACSPRSGD